MANFRSGDAATSSDRLGRYRARHQALALAGAHAAAGQLDGRIEVTLAAHGYGHLFAGRAELAAAAQTDWWQCLLGRLDAALDDELRGIPDEDTAAGVQHAWRETVCQLPGYLALAASAPGDVTVRRGTLRYARLLALFAGRASVDDEPIVAARAGLRLVEELSSSTAGAAAPSFT